VPVEILIVAAPLRSLIIALAHTNVRAGYGFFSLLITGPQYHRIHHSSRPEHIDKNFAELFPVWDVIFGTVWRPKPDEFRRPGWWVATCRRGFVDLIVWPVGTALRAQSNNNRNHRRHSRPAVLNVSASPNSKPALERHLPAGSAG
jgi:hypothetical protein